MLKFRTLWWFYGMIGCFNTESKNLPTNLIIYDKHSLSNASQYPSNKYYWSLAFRKNLEVNHITVIKENSEHDFNFWSTLMCLYFGFCYFGGTISKCGDLFACHTYILSSHRLLWCGLWRCDLFKKVCQQTNFRWSLAFGSCRIV